MSLKAPIIGLSRRNFLSASDELSSNLNSFCSIDMHPQSSYFMSVYFLCLLHQISLRLHYFELLAAKLSFLVLELPQRLELQQSLCYYLLLLFMHALSNMVLWTLHAPKHLHYSCALLLLRLLNIAYSHFQAKDTSALNFISIHEEKLTLRGPVDGLSTDCYVR